MAKSILPIIICLIFAFIAGYALLHPGLPPTHDGEYHVIRFYEFDKVLRSGVLYPRWAPDLYFGYGLPLFNYVYPLPNYFSSFLAFFGMSFIDAFKLNLFFATMLGGVLFYLWTREYFGTTGGVVASIFYSFTPYRFVDIYIRGSVGEVWALAFFPGFLWAAKKYADTAAYKYFVFSCVILAATIFSHNILAVMFFVYGIAYLFLLILQSKQKKRLFVMFGICILISLGISSIFWLPALFEKQFVTGLQIFSVKGNFPEIFQLFIPSWGSGFSGSSLEGQMSFQIGTANLLAFLLGTVCLFVHYKRRNAIVNTLIFQAAWFFVTLFLMLRVSYPLWERVPLLDYFQFPWRFLSLMLIVTSFLAGSVSLLFKNKLLSVGLVLFAVLLSINYARPAHYFERTDSHYLTRSNFIDGTNSPGNVFNTVWNENITKRAKSKLTIDPRHVHIIRSNVLPTKYTFILKASQDTTVTVNTTYFPGWSLFIDRQQADVENKKGLLFFMLPKGKHLVELAFLDTMVRRISLIVFFLSCLSLFALARVKMIGSGK